MTRRTYSAKEQTYQRQQRKAQRDRYREQAGLPVEEIAAQTERLENARAYRAAEQRDEMTLRRWLARYASVLWEPPIALPAAAPPPFGKVEVLDPVDYSWLSGSCGPGSSGR